MAHPTLLKCLFCGALFRADGRNAHHQKYCSAPACRKASKAASQRAWLAKPENHDYFRGPDNVQRVQAWRAGHPGYGRRAPGEQQEAPVAPQMVETAPALQDLYPVQAIETKAFSKDILLSPLQDLLRDQPAVLIGFIAHFTGSALQEDIARSTRRLLELGHDILAGRVGDDDQTGSLSRAGTAGAGPVQLG